MCFVYLLVHVHYLLKRNKFYIKKKKRKEHLHQSNIREKGANAFVCEDFNKSHGWYKLTCVTIGMPSRNITTQTANVKVFR